MLKNFFKVAWRNLWRNKGFSAINITGLSIGMAGAILILLWIQNEVSFDQFHKKRDRIYQAWSQIYADGKLRSWSSTPKPLARAVEKDLPEVEQATRVNFQNGFLMKVDDKRFMILGNHVDSNFLQVFSFPLIKGDPKTALNDTYSMVITEKLAVKLFGKEDAMGKMIRVRNTDNFTVTGILKDLPNNTSFDFECLVPWSYLRKKGLDDNKWNDNSTMTYVLLKPNASLASVKPKFALLKQRYDLLAKKENAQMFLYPISRWHLYSDFKNGYESGEGRITFVKLFGVIAAFILLIACINFMNLSTARSEKRAKEVGIRKVIGAQKASLIGQFIGESVLLAFLAGSLAMIIVQCSLPAFNTLVNKQLFIPYTSAYFWLSAVGFVLLTGFLAGSYPAFFLSSFRPVSVLKGTFKKMNALVTPRKALVVLQFTFAIILMICSIIVKQQIDYARSRQAGYDRSNLVYFYLSEGIGKNYAPIKNELYGTGTATSVTKTSAPLTDNWNAGWGQEWEGKDPNDKTDFRRYTEDGGLGKTARLTFIAGRDIDVQTYPADSSAMILNESALKVMKFKNPLGQIVRDMGQQWHVVGVVKDFILESPYEPIKPLLIYGPKGWFNIIQVKLNEKNTIAKNLKTIEAIIRKYDAEYLFLDNLVDEDYAKKFANEKRTGTLARLFAGLAIFISCLGLFGLATYMAEARVKEIGVRKVLGASIIDIAALLSKDFVKLVGIAIVISSPIAWLVMLKWLENYSYRVNISLLVFISTSVLAIAIALATVSFQAIKAAIANPIKGLRSE